MNSKRERTSRAITERAQRLAVQHGLDGFTMEQLAAEVGVSRRTLFNYFDGKVEAVLGEDFGDHSPAFAAFRDGGPTGDLVQDLRYAATAVVAAEGSVDTEWVLGFLRLLRSDARILHAVHLRLEKASEELTELIQTREGPDFSADQARVLARLLICMFEIALDAFLTDPATDLADHVGRTFDTVHDLLG